MNQTPKAMTVKQFAEASQFSTGWVYELIKTGKIPAFRIGRSLRIPASALEDNLVEPVNPHGGDNELVSTD